MKVAIMGAGLSGLSCAIVLEQNGVFPDIYEKRRMVGDRFINAESLFSISNRPIVDSLDYFRKEYGIGLQEISKVNEITILSENEKAVLKGELGYTNYRGRHEKSFERQLAAQIKSKIMFNSEYSLEELEKSYSHVVLSTGDGAYATKLKNYTCDLTINVKGAIVKGSFNPSHIMNWYNNSFAPQGYGYLLPISGKEADISLAYPAYEHNLAVSLDEYWGKFYAKVKKDTGQELDIVDGFEVERYIIGTCIKPKIRNTYFTGNCFGAIMPAFGLGQFVSILTGIYAAYDICGKGSYEELTAPLKESYENSIIIRRVLEKMDNKQLDIFVKAIGNKLAGRIFSRNIDLDVLKVASKFISLFINEKKET